MDRGELQSQLEKSMILFIPCLVVLVTCIVIIRFVCHQNEAVMKTVKFFNACNDTAAVEARRDDPLRRLIDDMGGWNVTGNMKSLSSMDITQRIGKVSSELFIKPFIDVKVFIDPHDSNKHILQVSFFKLASNL